MTTGIIDLVFTILQGDMDIKMAMDIVCLHHSSLLQYISKCLSWINPYKNPPDALSPVANTKTTTVVPHETYVIKPIANKEKGNKAGSYITMLFSVIQFMSTK